MQEEKEVLKVIEERIDENNHLHYVVKGEDGLEKVIDSENANVIAFPKSPISILKPVDPEKKERMYQKIATRVLAILEEENKKKEK
ncbi:MAG: hypothetical protein WDN67_00610 [Candidatus Moraniibacteriota bacterium]